MRLERPAFLALTLLLTATAILASGKNSSEGRFDRLTRAREGGVIAVAPLLVDDLDLTGRLRGDWKIYIDERTGMPTMASGPAVEWFAQDALGSLTLETLKAKARAFASDWGALLELDRDASGLLREGHWQLVFRQSVDGVIVENSRLDFHVVNGNLTLFGSTNWGAPAVSGLPEIDAGDARDFLDAYLDVATKKYEAVGEPKLVMMALDPDPALGRPRKWTGERGAGLTHALIWRLKFRDPESPAIWVGEIDAHDGSIRAFYDGAHYAAIRGGVYPEAPATGCISGPSPTPTAI